MLLKVLVYAYINNTYSSRKIEAALKENIHYMWLSGMNSPDHNTINRFRSERLKEVLRQVFTQVVLLLSEEGVLNIKSLYTDGTKIEANANRYYTFVWGNAIRTSKERIKKQLDELWQYAQNVAAAEMPDTEPGYNFQISTNNQYIINYSLHPTTADTTTLQEHTEIYKQQYRHLPETITADAGYGSEENYQYLQQNNIEN